MYILGYTDDVEILNLNTMAWSSGPSMPQRVGYASAEVFDNTMYVVGGNDFNFKILR